MRDIHNPLPVSSFSLHSNSLPVHFSPLETVKAALEKAMAPHSSTLAWKIPWTEEPGRLQSMGSLRIMTEQLHFHFSLSRLGEGNGNPLQCSCLENPRDGGAWWAAIYGVAQSRTRLKRLSSSSSSSKAALLLKVGCFWYIVLRALAQEYKLLTLQIMHSFLSLRFAVYILREAMSWVALKIM